ncbi:phosphotransferase family protein [Paenibacillus cymbidii]|uniref:phosphotransferase family protein n=1 Tax=Paenibacillus cymbidii TaxID=1639034 RepID=UPI0010802B6C|nr:aminoglycoside phosphotransferase family protein [Paenibacillus cymbidii]
MLESGAETAAYAVRRGWVAADVPLAVTRLAGGVSGNVWRIEGEGISWVLKQARAQLAVQATWEADPARIVRERVAMRLAGRYFEGEQIPELFYWNDEDYVLVMACAPDDMVTWKQELMDGRFVAATAADVGRFLARFHAAGARMSEEERRMLADDSFFRELRIEPYYRHLYPAYPALAPRLERLVADLAGSGDDRAGSTIVHGDFSPKNMLVSAARPPIVLDYEVAHWGNSVFDVAFCVTHLLLKGRKLGAPAAVLELIAAFLAAYGRKTPRLLPHVGALLLARMDGKSPAEYIGEALKPDIRRRAAEWLAEEAEEEAPLQAFARFLHAHETE